MNAEQLRLTNKKWKEWGPYVSNREWGNVREDYSSNGDAWSYTTHAMAESKAYRWAEEGIGGICDENQFLCFAVSMWNYKDAIVKERFFGLSNPQGNHGEDVKELFYYLDSTPAHSYMKMLYKYPQRAFPYECLMEENAKRSKRQPEFELMDTGIFDNNEYFDVFIEYAKADTNDLLVKISVYNRSHQKSSLKLLPTLWFRNTWAWGYDNYKPQLSAINNSIAIDHRSLELKHCYISTNAELLFCDNETNNKALYHVDNQDPYYKDGINRYIIRSDEDAINSLKTGTKAAFCVNLDIDAGASASIQLRICANDIAEPFVDFEKIFVERISEADAFYNDIQKGINSPDSILIHRQAIAGLLWNKQFYHYNVDRWLRGDLEQITPPASRWHIRNTEWLHLNNHDVISMPDKWEYPWYASWDLAFHCIALSLADPDFAKQQLILMTREWYMHPNGEFPAFEWDFNSVNPPVYGWAAFRVFKIAEKEQGKADIPFLEEIFQKLLLNFTWWVNRKDKSGNNIFEGGFLGMDNIGLFDRNERLPGGAYLEQADATGWMAMYALNMMRIALELALYNNVYESMATKFFEHFLYIADAIDNMGNGTYGLWDDDDEFFYDAIKADNNNTITLKLRSMVGLIPMFAVEVFEDDMLNKLPAFAARMKWVLDNKPQLANLVSHWDIPGERQKRLLSLLRGHRLKKILQRMLDTAEFLSDFGVRSLSKVYEEMPYVFSIGGKDFTVHYEPAESNSGMFGGNSNWRGPIWMPLNFLIIESLQRFYFYFGDDFKVAFPTGSNNMLSLNEIAKELGKRLSNIFLRDNNGRRPMNGDYDKLQQDEHFKDYIMFYEYFHGDTGMGLGASHQTGWTALVAKLLQPRFEE